MQSPSVFCNCFSRIYFCWLIALFSKGNKKTLESEDVYDVLDEDRAAKLGAKLSLAWNSSVNRGRPNLWTVLARVFGRSFLTIGLFYFVNECIVNVLKSLCLGQFLHYYGSNTKLCYFYGGALVLTSALYTTIHNPVEFSAYHLGLKLSSGLTMLVYKKVLVLSLGSFGSLTDTGHVTNLMSGDVRRFETQLYFLHGLWIGPSLLVIVISILWTQYGVDTVVGFIVFALLLPFQGLMGRAFAIVRAAVAEKTDDRLSILSALLHSVNIVKIYTWEPLYSKLVGNARAKEAKWLRLQALLTSVYNSSYLLSPKLAFLVTIVVLALYTSEIQAEKVFVTMSLYNATATMMSESFTCGWHLLLELNVTLKRVQSFLLLESNNIVTSKTIRINPEPENVKPGKVTLFTYSGAWNDGEPDLENISFSSGSGLTVIIGPTGSGKTCLLSAILGELHKVSGAIIVRGSIAYTSQNAWVFNGTIRENILFNKPMDRDFYSRVIAACSLEEDLAAMPEWDNTLVGDRGITLSGGQRARISLARAVYAETSIILLDDPLSAVDPHVAVHILNACILGLLANKCVLLVTHQFQLLSKEQKTLLIRDKRLEAVGSLGSILEKCPELMQNMTGFSDKSTYSGAELPESQESEIVGCIAMPTSESAPLLQKEAKSEGGIGISMCWKFLRLNASLPLAILLIISIVFATALSSGSDYFLQYWVNTVEKANQMSITMKLQAPGIGLNGWIYILLLATFISLTLLTEIWFYLQLLAASTSLHNMAFFSILHSPMRFFDINSAGRILNRFSKDLGSVDELLPAYMFNTLQASLNTLGLFGLVCILNPILVIPSVIALYLAVRLRRYYLRSSTALRRLEANARSPIVSHLSMTVLGITSIRAYAAQDRVRFQFEEVLDKRSAVFYLMQAASTWVLINTEWIGVAYIAAVTLAFIVFPGSASAAGIALSGIISLNLNFSYAVQKSTYMESELVSVERMLEYSNLTSEAPASTAKGYRWKPSLGKVDLVNLVLKYDQEPVLKGITCTFKASEKVGIVGRTGAGKSSIINAMLRFVEASSGSIFIDGVNIAELGLRDLRSNISVIPQEPGFIQGTLRNNLDPFNSYSDDELYKALEDVHLNALVIENGLDSEIQENGSNFSAGERQLISLARALLHKDKILLLDEATANIDHAMDSLIQQIIRDKFKECTVITIAHRLQTVLDSDRICVMDDGKILEFDQPTILMANPDSHLSKLVRRSQNDSANLND